MFIKTYKRYLIKKYFLNLLTIFFIFSVLGFVMNFLKELKFFSEIEVNLYYPILLVLLDLPSLIFQTIPFILILSIIMTFLQLGEKNEILVFKNNGLTNIKILSIIGYTSFFLGIFSLIIFYNFSSILKFNYLNIKQNYSNDDKFLASITENGLWIKDENKNGINFINAEKIEINHLLNAEIIQLDKNFNYISIIQSPRIDIKDKLWILSDSKIIKEDNTVEKYDLLKFRTNFDYNKIHSLYSDLNSLTILGLLDLREDYKKINYSTVEIDYHLYKVLFYPLFLTIMSLLISSLILNFGVNYNKFQLIIFGIFVSLIIYYINDFFGVLGRNEKIPLLLSIGGPQIILLIIATIGMVRLNEK